ncbi:MAG: 3',5'-cyclic-nucleotide phosphodiesterase pde1 [Vezdaea aestivalis]|nr:MAG: 3',5'-cyclic-nucleotide phosphodiesterase pde1 [Vezdaea aestivalis]
MKKAASEVAGIVEECSSFEPALHVIVLGSGGGPTEDNVTGLLIRSTATHWEKGSVVAIDAGVHLASIARILEAAPNGPGKVRQSTNGGHFNVSMAGDPFQTLHLPHESAPANAAYITRELVSTYLITHPHLDHISGLVINTASYEHNTSKKLIAALPSTIEAIKSHIFNNVIWPNMSDENNGLGFVGYLRLKESAPADLRRSRKKGYVSLCAGLSVKCMSVSHGKCHVSVQTPVNIGMPIHHSCSASAIPKVIDEWYTYDSTAYFIKDDQTDREALIFGDIEPDSVSLHPRLIHVWDHAAPRIVSGLLPVIVVECSFDDSQSDKMLFGHLSPRHLSAELRILALRVNRLKYESGQQGIDLGSRKRKRQRTSTSTRDGPEASSPGLISPRHPPRQPEDIDVTTLSTDEPSTSNDASSPLKALSGVTILIIHVKDSLKDGVDRAALILSQLESEEVHQHLGCKFIMSRRGGDILV